MDYKNFTPWHQMFFFSLYFDILHVGQNKHFWFFFFFCQSPVFVLIPVLPEGHIPVSQLSKGVIKLDTPLALPDIPLYPQFADTHKIPIQTIINRNRSGCTKSFILDQYFPQNIFSRYTCQFPISIISNKTKLRGNTWHPQPYIGVCIYIHYYLWLWFYL